MVEGGVRVKGRGGDLIPDLNTLYNTLTPLVQEAAQKQICIDL